MMEKKIYNVYCTDTDYYLGEALHRELLNTGHKAILSYNDIPIKESDTNYPDTNFYQIAIINKSLLEENEEFINYIKDLTAKKQTVFLLNNGNSSPNFPETWGKCHLIEVDYGLTPQILSTITETTLHPIDKILDPQKEAEERERIKEEELIQQQILYQKQKEEQEKIQLALHSASLRKYKRKIQFLQPEEMILDEGFHTEYINKAISYLLGKEVPKDGERAYSILKKIISEEPNNQVARYYIGVCLYFNFGLNKEANPNETMEFIFREAADNDIIPAIILLGINLGLNPKTASEGSIVLSRLQQLGYNKALYYIALGKELEGNLDEAIELYYSAAEENIAEAQNALGCLYAEGLGVAQNLEIALQWFELAKSNNLYEASVNLDKLSHSRNDNSKNQISIKLPSWKKLTDNLKSFNLENLKNIDKQQVKEKSEIIKDKIIAISKEVVLQAWDNLNSLINWSKTGFSKFIKLKDKSV